MSDIQKRTKKPSSETLKFWKVLNVYERFEQVIALILSGVIAVIIVIALWRLIEGVFTKLVSGALNPLEHGTFVSVFGMVMTLLIAMEFKHSIIKVVLRREHIIQVKTVILIAQLALARKFITLDLKNTEAMQIFALGFAVLVLAVAHWLLRERDRIEDRDDATSVAADSTSKNWEDR